MANILTAVIPRLLAQGLMALRENSITPRLVNRSYESLAGQRGSAIDVPIPSAIVAQVVSPAAVPPSTADIAPTFVAVPLDQWYEAPFELTDKDLLEVMEGTIPMQASAAIKALANNVDRFILGLYPSFYSFSGTPGTTPFGSSTADATTTRKLLNKELAPLNDRHFIIDPDAEANALNLRAFQDASWSGTFEAIINGRLNERLGFNWWMDQNIPTHTAGTLSDGTDHQALTNGALLAGVTTMAIDSATLTGTVVVGDIFTFAGHTQTYVATNLSTAAGNAIAAVTFAPALRVNVGDGVVVTFQDTHVVNLAWQRDAIAFATRPLQQTDGLGSVMSSAVDPISGLTLRLEVSREHKRTRYSFDILYGAKVVRPELGARLAG